MLTVQRKKYSIMSDGIPISCQIYKIRAVIYFYITKTFFVLFWQQSTNENII